MNAPATEEFRVRIDPKLLRDTKRVTESMGTTPGDIVRMLFAMVVKLQALPFRPSNYPALEEYGVTPGQAQAALARATKELEAEKRAGRLVQFKGKLP